MSNLALKSRAAKAKYEFNGSSLRLTTTFEKLELLRAETESDPIVYITEVLAPLGRVAGVQDGGKSLNDAETNADLTEFARRLHNVLFCLQDDDANYTKAEIYDAFLGNWTDFFSEANFVQVMGLIPTLLGNDVRDELEVIEQALASKTAQKKAGKSNSTFSTPLGSI